MNFKTMAVFNWQKVTLLGWRMHPMVQPLPPQINRVWKVDVNDDDDDNA